MLVLEGDSVCRAEAAVAIRGYICRQAVAGAGAIRGFVCTVRDTCLLCGRLANRAFAAAFDAVAATVVIIVVDAAVVVAVALQMQSGVALRQLQSGAFDPS